MRYAYHGFGQAPARRPLTPEEQELERHIVRARELWRPALRRPGLGFGCYSGAPTPISPYELSAVQHLGWVALGAPEASLGSRLVDALKQCLRELGKPNLIGRAVAMSACLAGFLAGPEAAPAVWLCLKILGITLTLAFVAQLLACLAAKML